MSEVLGCNLRGSAIALLFQQVFFSSPRLSCFQDIFDFPLGTTRTLHGLFGGISCSERLDVLVSEILPQVLNVDHSRGPHGQALQLCHTVLDHLNHLERSLIEEFLLPLPFRTDQLEPSTQYFITCLNSPNNASTSILSLFHLAALLFFIFFDRGPDCL